MATERLRTIAPSGGDYTTVAAWEAGEQADIVAADEYRVGEISGDWSSGADTTAVTILGWTTDATRYIELRAVGSARHAGKWTASAHRLECGDASSLLISENFVRVIGLQAKVSSASSTSRQAFSVSAIDAGGSGILFAGCLAWGDVSENSGTNTAGFRISDGDATTAIRNCIAWDWVGSGGTTGAGFVCAGAVLTLTNCTAYGCRIGYNRATGTCAARNCGSAAHTSGGFSGTISQTTNSSTTPTFVDAANDDFHLASGDTTWRDAGTDYSATFTDDVDGATRAGSWDIGADEYAAGGTDATATPAGVSAASSVGTPTATGTATATPAGVSTPSSVGATSATGTAATTPAGVQAAASVGTATASGSTVVNGTATPSGNQAAASIGTPTATGTARVSPAGVSASAAVGTPTATGTGSSVATPAGVQAAASVGTPGATGTATATPAGVGAVSAVGAPTASAGVNATATPSGVSSAAAVGTPTVSGTAAVYPGGLFVTAVYGTPTARGDARATPAGVGAVATVGTPSAFTGGATALPLFGRVSSQLETARIQARGETAAIFSRAETARIV